MIAHTFRTHKIDGQVAFDRPGVIKVINLYERALITVEPWTEHREISYQQIRWWKGVLLPALVKDQGDTLDVWETRLKLAVMPDEFTPKRAIIDRRIYTFIPSITKLSMGKLNTLIEGSVAKCHEWGFDWVTLPDEAKRKIP